MDVVGYVPGSLKEVVNLITEKDIRLRFPIEELRILLEEEKDEGLVEEIQSPNLIEDMKHDC